MCLCESAHVRVSYCFCFSTKPWLITDLSLWCLSRDLYEVHGMKCILTACTASATVFLNLMSYSFPPSSLPCSYSGFLSVSWTCSEFLWLRAFCLLFYLPGTLFLKICFWLAFISLQAFNKCYFSGRPSLPPCKNSIPRISLKTFTLLVIGFHIICMYIFSLTDGM